MKIKAKTVNILSLFLMLWMSIISREIVASTHTNLPGEHDPLLHPSPMIVKNEWDAFTNEFTLSGKLVLKDNLQRKNLISVNKVFSLDVQKDSLILTAWVNPGSIAIKTYIDGIKTDGTPQEFLAKVQLSGKVYLTVGDRSNFKFPGMWPTLSNFPSKRDVIIAANGRYNGSLSELSLRFDSEIENALQVDAQGTDSEMPKLSIRDEFGNLNVYIGDKWLLHMREYKYLTFRSNTTNDAWIGTNRSPGNLAFNYQLPESFPLTNIQVTSQLLTDGFKINLVADKENAPDVHESTVITAKWLPSKSGFTYKIEKRLWGELESWKKIDSWSNINNTNKGKLEFIDFHFNRMSLKDNTFMDYKAGDLYDGVYFYGTAKHGDKWMWIPKLQVPYTLRSINGRGSSGYIFGFNMKPNGITAILDPEEGGWTFEQSTAIGTRYVEVCWSWYDIHFLVKDLIFNDNKLDIQLAMDFTPATPAEATSIIQSSTEVNWRNNPEYQIPTFYWDGRLNEFTDQIGGLSGGKEWEEVIYPTSEFCSWDKTQGAKSAPSLKIEHSNAGYLSAWYASIDYPYLNDVNFGKPVKITAKIKTEDVEESVLFGAGSGIDVPHKVTDPDPINRVPAAPVLKGTNDWTDVTIEFIADSVKRTHPQVFFYLRGKGKAWLDDLQVSVNNRIATSVGILHTEYHNPVYAYIADKEEISISGWLAGNPVAYLYDLHGKMLLSQRLIEGNQHVIKARNLCKGFYLLSIQQEKRNMYFKLLNN